MHPPDSHGYIVVRSLGRIGDRDVAPEVLMALESEAAIAEARTRDDLEVVVTMDRFVLIFPTSDAKARRNVERTLFDYVATDYENVIDYDSNRANICGLVGLVGKGSILDYGCGPGLGSSLHLDGVTVTGYDKSESMVQAGRDRGINVLTLEQLAALPDRSFDGMIASYVLHLREAFDDFHIAAPKVKVGGLFAANFHKEEGLQEAMAVLRKFGYAEPVFGIDTKWGRRLAWKARE